MSFQSDIIALKDESFDAHKELGKGMTRQMDAVAKKAVSSLEEEIFRPKRNTTQLLESDKKLASDALNRVDVAKYIRKITDIFRKEWPALQLEYYQDTFKNLGQIYNRNSPVWAEYSVKFSKKELNTLTSYVFGRTVSELVANVENQKIFQMETIAIDGYAPVEGAKKDFRIKIRDNLQSAFNGLINQMNNILRGIVQSTYEQAFNRFMSTIK